MDKLDWTLTRSFLAVAETGSLSAAARALNLSQPTLGRHIADLEDALDLTLFRRKARGLAPTEAAEALLPHARAMREAAAKLSLVAAGKDNGMSGTVRITASRIVSHYLLPQMLATLRAAEPAIQIELAPSDDSENLLFREADIAVRMYRPTQLDVIATHLCDMPIGLYAAKSYLEARGIPASIDSLLTHDFVGFDKSDLMLRLMHGLGFEAKREDFPIRCDDQIVYWNLVRAGLGIGGMQTLIADPDPGVTRIAQFIPLPPLPVWLAAPQALRHSPRIRRVFDHLSASFKALRLDP
jgi:DNA-binding transcriptional LysR family regulator